MKRKMLFAVLIVGISVMFIQSCNVNGCSRGDMTSSIDGQESKKMVGNCMNCHGPNGTGSGCFTIGGTVYDTGQTTPYANAVVKFYTQPNGGGQLVATLDVDKSGNFYTTAIINFNNGLYPAVISKTSNRVQYMPSPTVIGACGSCHGITNIPIWIN